ncbi:hypothetical protein ACHWQZ_G009029 [Mnemiopsis leidyi]
MSRLEGPKHEDPDFYQTLYKSSIFCLQETKQEFYLPNYKCFNSNRTRSRSGGVCIGVHRSIIDQVRPVETNCPDFQALTVFPNVEDEHSRFTIINIYDSPENSSFKAKLNAGGNNERPPSTLDQLLEFLASKDNLGDIMVLGDLNARIGLSSPTFEDEDTETQPEFAGQPKSHPVTSDRASKDTVLNSRGKLLLDFLACTRLTVLNGCTLGDVLGEVTSVNYNGCSVVDYVAVNPNLRRRVVSFKVLDLTKYSDHKPCLCKIRAKSISLDAEELIDQLEDAPRKYKWDNENDRLHYNFLAIQNLQYYDSKIKEISQKQCHTSGEVIELNESLVQIYQEMADRLTGRASATSDKKTSFPACRSSARKRRPRMKPKSAWFDIDCIKGKRELNRTAKRYGADPTNDLLRALYYDQRKSYRRLIKSKKEEFIADLCRDIEKGKNINWSRFKKMKDLNSKGRQLDIFDMRNFCDFFKKLYGKTTLSQKRIADLKRNMDGLTLQEDLSEVLDCSITLDEVESCINATKRGKAVAEDLIPNEFFKSSGRHLRLAILNLFNHCLSTGTYPWSTSVVTPLHKKGSIYDPNNYRAIAVASNLGKLFASILLKRLIAYRSVHSPDTVNQLGFCQNATTSDHILTLTTCIEKYVTRSKKRLYSCFVDYAKAFDTVCREALLFKLWKMGIQGKFFNCLQHMYTNSSAKVKLLNKLSEKIDILCGTEQGHPMSPELFKCFVHELSEQLNAQDEDDVPTLNGKKITHLLWADDLVLLALNPEGLQKMLNVLHVYCLDWGLSVNISKTAVMVFNRSGRLLKESKSFFYGETQIAPAREYTYLGIVFSLSGSLKKAQTQLRQKGLRSYFSLKRMMNLGQLKKNIIFKLFDALILPVVSYGCPVWLPYTTILRSLTSNTNDILKKTSQDPIEKVHLSFLKWTLGVGKFTSNAAVWGDSGRHPLAIELLEQVFAYQQRLEQLDRDNSLALVRHAYAEQKLLNLTWFSNLRNLHADLCQEAGSASLSPKQIRGVARSVFQGCWNRERKQNRKLCFYNSIKDKLEIENYLQDVNLKPQQLKRIAQMRTSSHRLNIETGRHGIVKRNTVLNRVCHHCSDLTYLEYLAELPFFDPICEDEIHVLKSCPLYEDLRTNAHPAVKEHLQTDLKELFTDKELLPRFGGLISKIFDRRFAPCPGK